MLIPKNYANQMRSKILVKVVESFYKDRFETADEIPVEMRPKDYDSSRCCIYKDRAVLKYRMMAAMGVTPQEETNEVKRLSEYGKEALKRQHHAKSCLSVIDIACSACVKSQYMVTDACRGCFARPCMMNCPKQAISIVNGRSHIDPDICVSCGKCMEVCPYHAVVKLPVPCEEACPVGAIKKDEHGVEHVNEDLCISCGKCLQSCPFGAVVERSQIVDVLSLLQQADKKVVAMLAPAVVGQFPFEIGQVVGALKKLGFADVVEVAAGADITSANESAEFL
ncbi:MAG: 4Fe-4S binding protein, partial [Alphaproteobacteria bacterium]|nr:4Fe-4S binding protein [Alphaproteobacteria bacterium]